MEILITAIIINRIHDTYWSYRKNGKSVRREVSIAKSIVRTIVWAIAITLAIVIK